MEEKTRKRRKVTFTDLIFEMTDKQSDAVRLEVYDAVFRSQFGGKKIDYEKLSDVAQVIVLSLEIELNKMQSKYKNGCAKKRNFRTDAFACRQNASEMKQNETENSGQFGESESYLYYNIYNNNLDNSKVKSTQAGPDACSGLELKSEMMTVDALRIVLEPIKMTAQALYERMAGTLNGIIRSSKPFRINGYSTTKEQVLQQILKTTQKLAPGELQETLQIVYAKVDSKNIKGDMLPYEAAALFNMLQAAPAPPLPEQAMQSSTNYTYNQKLTKADIFITRNYTSEEANAVFDDLDTTEI